MDKNIERKEFKKQLNIPTAYFSIFYIGYAIVCLVRQNYTSFLAIFGVGIFVFGYLYGIRPYKYTIEKRTLIINRRILKNKEYNVMEIDTISNPIPKMTKIITNPRSYEIYLMNGKRLTVAPKNQMEFVEAIIKANKRIHCQVKEYNETHRKVEKRRRRENKREDKNKLESETV